MKELLENFFKLKFGDSFNSINIYENYITICIYYNISFNCVKVNGINMKTTKAIHAEHIIFLNNQLYYENGKEYKFNKEWILYNRKHKLKFLKF